MRAAAASPEQGLSTTCQAAGGSHWLPPAKATGSWYTEAESELLEAVPTAELPGQPQLSDTRRAQGLVLTVVLL